MRTIDLNADLGEGFGQWRMGDDEAMLDIVTSANVACGGHAGDPETMFQTAMRARSRGVVVGAHPSYPDLEGFGRRRLPCSAAEIERFVAAQIGALIGVASLAGVHIAYVKLHGALGNLAADDPATAGAVVRAIAAVDRNLAVLAISGTVLEDVARASGLDVYSEIYADRGYTAQGRLVPRDQPAAMIEDPSKATHRLIEFLRTGLMPVVAGNPVKLNADSICIHGDSAHAVEMASSVREALTASGLTIAPFLRR